MWSIGVSYSYYHLPLVIVTCLLIISYTHLDWSALTASNYTCLSILPSLGFSSQWATASIGRLCRALIQFPSIQQIPRKQLIASLLALWYIHNWQIPNPSLWNSRSNNTNKITFIEHCVYSGLITETEPLWVIWNKAFVTGIWISTILRVEEEACGRLWPLHLVIGPTSR